MYHSTSTVCTSWCSIHTHTHHMHTHSLFHNVGDASASNCLSEAEIDERVKLYVEMEDPDIVFDLRELQSARKSKFDVFWDECHKFLQEDVGLAVDERRHSQVTHMSRAISVRDLLEQVEARCPPSTPIPSRSWLSLQFWPKSAHAHSRIHYTGRFPVKYMVQARQFRKEHEDAHYAAAVFRYQRELAVEFQHNSVFVCMDDKHRLKVGEPNYPVAAAERGKKVLVGRNESFEVADHDFTKFSLIPSVSLVVDIPNDITGSWYVGQVMIGLKEGSCEPSSPHRHVTELHDVLNDHDFLTDKSILFVYSDGGPDHRLTYLSVKLSLISLYLKNDLDFLCACRTAPYHSWRNPAERVMSIVNLGLQCVGLMRTKVSDDVEASLARCNNLSQLRSEAEKNPEVKVAIIDSIEPVKVLLSTVFQRLSLHDKKFKMFTAANDEKLRELWSELHTIDPTLEYGKVYRQASLKELAGLATFLQHCCCSRHYCFSIKKCGDPVCTICKPVRMPKESFEKLHHLPDPVPGEDGHYTSFTELYGKFTSEEHRPSKQGRKGKQKTLPFSASVQHVKNVDVMVMCEECEMWRLLYSQHKLNNPERLALQAALSDVTYTCGAQIQDLQLSGKLAEVYARDVRCYEPIEKLYYSVGRYELICIYCASDENLDVSDDFYPQCSQCSDKERVKKRK